MKTLFGRNIWYDPPKIIGTDLDNVGGDTSKQMFDIYSFSHITHGILFFLFFENFKVNVSLALILTIVIETIWEIIENTQFFIKIWRNKKEYKNYTGDSIVNIISDIFMCILGFYIAYESKTFAIIFIFITEIILTPLHASFHQMFFDNISQRLFKI